MSEFLAYIREAAFWFLYGAMCAILIRLVLKP